MLASECSLLTGCTTMLQQLDYQLFQGCLILEHMFLMDAVLCLQEEEKGDSSLEVCCCRTLSTAFRWYCACLPVLMSVHNTCCLLFTQAGEVQVASYTTSPTQSHLAAAMSLWLGQEVPPCQQLPLVMMVISAVIPTLPTARGALAVTQASARSW
jgi:hypothetical protein